MPVDERSRHRLYNKAVEVLGEEEATTLMEHLPPGGASDLATKQDLVDLERRMDANLDVKVADLRSFTLRTVLVTNVTSIVAVAGVAFAAARLV